MKRHIQNSSILCSGPTDTTIASCSKTAGVIHAHRSTRTVYEAISCRACCSDVPLVSDTTGGSKVLSICKWSFFELVHVFLAGLTGLTGLQCHVRQSCSDSSVQHGPSISHAFCEGSRIGSNDQAVSSTQSPQPTSQLPQKRKRSANSKKSKGKDNEDSEDSDRESPPIAGRNPSRPRETTPPTKPLASPVHSARLPPTATDNA